MPNNIRLGWVGATLRLLSHYLIVPHISGDVKPFADRDLHDLSVDPVVVLITRDLALGHDVRFEHLLTVVLKDDLIKRCL